MPAVFSYESAKQLPKLLLLLFLAAYATAVVDGVTLLRIAFVVGSAL